MLISGKINEFFMVKLLYLKIKGFFMKFNGTEIC